MARSKRADRFVKFTIADAKKLSEIIAGFGNARTRANHTRLLLMMFWTCDQRDGGTTSAGASELAKLSGVSVSQAQRFLESGERGGWLRRVGTKKTRGGEFVVREIVGIFDRHEEPKDLYRDMDIHGYDLNPGPWNHFEVDEALLEEAKRRLLILKGPDFNLDDFDRYEVIHPIPDAPNMSQK